MSFMKLFPPKTIISLVIVFFLSAGLSYALVPSEGGSLISPNANKITEENKNSTSQFAREPVTEACPLNGKLYTQSAKKLCETRRPILTMIENAIEARPQSGLSSADIVYEAVAEGGITRFMGVFYCGIAAQSVNLAPVRSARTYFLPWVLEYDAAYNHVGGAGVCSDPTVDERAKALCQID